MATCKGCGAAIAWVRLTSGKSNPVDPDRYLTIQLETTGNEILVTDEGEVVRGSTVGPREAQHLPNIRTGRRSHFATCPAAKSFRKAKAASATKEGKTA